MRSLVLVILLLLLAACQSPGPEAGGTPADTRVQLGPRPFFLLDGLDDGPLKSALQACAAGPFEPHDFSIGHRGAPLQFPEHTEESYRAAARMGAGILECDTSFTRDGQLVCRHAQCDLHTTTNIVTTPLNAQCTVPWNVADPNPGSVKCCTSDLTLAEFKSLTGRMDTRDQNATSAEAYLGVPASWRTDLYSSRGTLLTHRESIDLFRELGVKYTPELKAADREAHTQVEDVFGSQAGYAQRLIDDYKAAGVAPEDVFPQSFDLQDVHYWIENEPDFGAQAILLDSIDPFDPDNSTPPSRAELQTLADSGVGIIAPPLWALLDVDAGGAIVPSQYARDARAAGLEIITWTLERSDLRQGSGSDWYYRFDDGNAITRDSDLYRVLDVLARDVGVIGVFSDWPAVVTYYANCML